MMQTPIPQPLQETKRKRAMSKAKQKEVAPWELSDSEGELSEGDDDEEVDYLPGKKIKEMTEFLPAPFRDEEVDLTKEFPKRILYQPVATYHLALFVRGLRTHVRERSRSGTGRHVRDRIHRYILSGPSGVGKTESVEMVRHWLGMDPGWLYEKQFIYVDGSLLKESTQTTRLIGAGAGYVGHESKSCLVHELLDAVVPAEENILGRLNRSTKLYKRKCREYHARRKLGLPLEPPFILLFFDEIDKVHPDVITTLNGFLETGEIKSSQGRRFVLPQVTELIVLFTSNFGDRQIAKMALHDVAEATEYVEDAMLRHGLQQCSISRFGMHLIYFPISEERMTAIICSRVASFMKTDRMLTQKYGDIDYQAALECVAQFIRTVTRGTRSVRDGLSHVFNALDPLLQDAFYRLEHTDAEDVRLGLSAKLGEDDPALQLFQESFRLETLEESEPSTAIVQSIQSNPLNTANLEVYRAKAPKATIQAFGLSHGNRIINCIIVPFIVNQYTIHRYDSKESREVITELKEKVERLEEKVDAWKEDYRCLADAVISLEGQDAALEEVKLLAAEKLEQLDMSDESEEEQQRYRLRDAPKKRKAGARQLDYQPDVKQPRSAEKEAKFRARINELGLVMEREMQDQSALAQALELVAQQAAATTPEAMLVEPEEAAVETQSTAEEEDDDDDDDDDDEEEEEEEEEQQQSDNEMEVNRICKSCNVERDIAEFATRRSGSKRKNGTRGPASTSSCWTCRDCRYAENRDRERRRKMLGK